MTNSVIPFSPGAQVVAYLRDSGGDRQDLSIEQQETAVRQWCAENSLSLLRIYADEARPGSSTTGREQFLCMIDELPQSAAEGVILWRYNRFARDYNDAQYYIADLRRNGKTVHSIMDAVPDTLDGRLFESIIHWKDAKYLQDLSEDIKRGNRNLIVNHHGWQSSRIPTGYQAQRVEIGKRRDGTAHLVRRLVPDPDAAPLVRQAFEMADSGRSLSEIRIRTDLHRDVSGIAKMLSNKIYIGVYDHGDIYVERFCKPIIDKALFERVQKERKRARKRQGYNHPRAVHSNTYPLTGMIFCANCGAPMQGIRFHDWRYYRCWRVPSRVDGAECTSAGIRADTIEGDILDRLRYILDTPTVLDEMAQRQYEQRKQAIALYDAQVKRKQGDLERIASQIARITDALASRPKSAALLGKLDDLEREQVDAMRALSDLESLRPESGVSATALASILDDVRSRLDNANERDIILLLRSLNTKVVALRDTSVRDATAYSGTVTFDFGVMIKMPIGAGMLF